MVSATVRAYRGGRETLPARRELVLDYLNTVPLSAAPVYGEVHGLGDGLWVWFGADFDDVNRLLAAPEGEGEFLKAQGLALRQVLGLMIAHRRPSHYLARGRDDLARLTDAHLRILAEAGVIGIGLRDAALARTLRFRAADVDPARVPVETDKGSMLVRTRLAGMLDVSLYDLDRIDLRASATLDRELQQAISDYLERLADARFAQETGILGERLLTPGKLRDVRYRGLDFDVPEFPRLPGARASSLPPPELGEHTLELLQSAGIEPRECDAMLNAGAIASPRPGDFPWAAVRGKDA
jgi:membrane peptidoglycan carboxypeptidase